MKEVPRRSGGLHEGKRAQHNQSPFFEPSPGEGLMSKRWQKALDEFVCQLRRQYGSRARGDAEEESDIDTVVLLNPSEDFWTEGHVTHLTPLPSAHF